MTAKPAPGPAARAPADIFDPAVPRLVTGLVERPSLFALLDRAGPVTLLSAPAGSGKTMLLSSWLRSARLPGAVAWVGVERDEADATHFWGMVMDGERPAHPGRGRRKRQRRRGARGRRPARRHGRLRPPGR